VKMLQKGNYEYPTTKQNEQLVELADQCGRVLLALNKSLNKIKK